MNLQHTSRRLAPVLCAMYSVFHHVDVLRHVDVLHHVPLAECAVIRKRKNTIKTRAKNPPWNSPQHVQIVKCSGYAMKPYPGASFLL